MTTHPPVLVTIQVIVNADPAEAENVAASAADFVTESFTEEQGAVVHTAAVHTGPVTYGPSFATGADLFGGEPEGLLAGDEDPRTFAILALHADVVREDAQWSGYDDESEDATDRERIVRLEGLVERLAAQVSELALRLAQEA